MQKHLMMIIAAMALLAGNGWAGGYRINDTVKPFDLNDQFGKQHRFEQMPKTMILVFERGTAARADEYFRMRPKGYLSEHNAVYIADISIIPSFVAEGFAIPKMREYSFPVLLIRDEEFSLRFPAQDGKITVLHFETNVVRRIDYVETADALKSAIEQ